MMHEMINDTKEGIRKSFHERVVKKMIWEKPLNPADRELMNKWIDNFNPDLQVLKHYTNKKILFEIVKYLKNNELCISEKIRWLYCSKVEYLSYDIFFYHVLEKLKSFYCGLVNFKERPRAPYHPKEKREWQNDYWSGREPAYMNFIKSCNFGIDLDAKDFKESYKEARALFKYFTKFKIRFSVWCSGKKGWHFIIPSTEFKELVKPFSVDNAVVFCKAMCSDLISRLKLKHVDEVIYSATRYLKCPYSLDARNKRVVYPLNDREFLDFGNDFEKYMSMDYCYSQSNLGFRGVYLNRESNPGGFLEMLRNIGDNV